MKKAELLNILNKKINQLKSNPFCDDNMKVKKLLDGLIYIRDELPILYDRVEDGEVLPNEFEILSKKQFDLIAECSNYSKMEDIKKLPKVMRALCSNIGDFDLFYDNDHVVKMAEVSLYGCPKEYIIYLEEITFKGKR